MNLTKTAILVKQIIFFTVIFIITGIITFVGYQAAYNYYVSRRPIPEEQPNNKFGPLPPLDLPKSVVPSSSFTYSLDTTTGNLPKIGQDPNFKRINKVFYINKSVATFLSPDRAEEFARKFNITNPPQILSETLYRFFQDDKTLTVELDTQNFKFANIRATPSNQLLPSDRDLIEGFRGILSNTGVLKEELRDGPGKVTLLLEEKGKLLPTNARSEAKYAHISLWPKSVDGKLIFSPKFNVSLVSALVVGSSGNLANYLSIEYTYWSVDTTNFATYAAKSLEKAFEELKSGQGTVIIEPGSPNISITAVSPGYYLPENFTSFLQPIYIFEGPQFVAYVGALDASRVLPTQNLNSPSQ